MADILDQDEIDALLSAISTGGIETTDEKPQVAAEVMETKEKVVQKYDFRRPDIVSKDQMRTLQMLHKTFCRHLTTSLSAYLRTIVEVNLVAVDQLTYGEFNMSLSNPTCINVFSMKPMEGRGVLEVNPVLVHSIIDRLLGGTGEPPSNLKPLTDIEQSIISKIVDIFLAGLAEAWKSIIEFHFRVEEREVNPQFVQIVAPGETVILISCEMRVGNISGIVSLCFPFVYLEPIMSSLNAQHWISSTQKKPTDDMRTSIKFQMSKSYMQVNTILGKSVLSIRQLLSLRKGDVVVLSQKVRDPLLTLVKGRNRFLTVPGILGKQKAVKIVSVIQDKIRKG
ncbi:MAG: Flagellar motor switch protein FliM [uncultured bacterium]|nr:MAG: Flagellar motor switch protein FliM [uncultured bacterium]